MAAPILITVFSPNAFVVQSADGSAYDLLSANVSTGVVTSAYLPANATNFLTLRFQKLLTLLPSLTATALKTLIRNLVTLDQLEGEFTATVTATGSNYALGLSDIETPSNLQVSIPFSTSSPFAVNGAPVAPTVESLDVLFGTFGTYQQTSRVWGYVTKTGGSSGLSMVGAGTPGESGTITAPSLASVMAAMAIGTPVRWWNSYATSAGANAIAGHRSAGGTDALAWLTRPRLNTLIGIISALTDTRIWVAMTDTTLDQLSSSNAAKYVGLRFDSTIHATNWYLCSSDGTTATEADTGVPLVVGEEQNIVLDFSSAPSIIATINDTIVGTKTTNLPVTGNAGYNICITTLTAAVKTVYWHHTMLSRQ